MSNRFYNPIKSQHVSQYAPVKHPWELAYREIKERDKKAEDLLATDLSAGVFDKSYAIEDVGYGVSKYGNRWGEQTMGKRIQSQNPYAQELNDIRSQIADMTADPSNNYDPRKAQELIRRGRFLQQQVGSMAAAAQAQGENVQEYLDNYQSVVSKDVNAKDSPWRYADAYEAYEQYDPSSGKPLPNTFAIGKHVDRYDLINKYTQQLGHYLSEDERYEMIDGNFYKNGKRVKGNDARLDKIKDLVSSETSKIGTDIRNQAKWESNLAYQTAIRNGASEEEAEKRRQDVYVDVVDGETNDALNQLYAKKVYEQGKTTDFDANLTGREEERRANNVPVFKDQQVSILSDVKDQELLKKGKIDELSDPGKKEMSAHITEKLKSGTLSGKDKLIAEATLLNLNKDEYNRKANEIFSNNFKGGNLEFEKAIEEVYKEMPEIAGFLSGLNFEDANIDYNANDGYKIDLFELSEEKLSDDTWVEKNYGVKDFGYADNKLFGLIDNEEILEKSEIFTTGIKTNSGIQFDEGDKAYSNALQGTTSMVTVKLSDGSEVKFEATEEELANYPQLSGNALQDNIDRTFQTSGTKVVNQKIDGRTVPQEVTVDNVALKNFISSKTGTDIDDDVTVNSMSATTNLSPDKADNVRAENIKRLEDRNKYLYSELANATNENQVLATRKQLEATEEALFYQEQPNLAAQSSKIKNMNYNMSVPITNNNNELMFNISRDSGDVTEASNQREQNIDPTSTGSTVPAEEVYGDRYVFTDGSGNKIYEAYAPEGMTTTATFKKIYKDFVGSNEFQQLSQKKQDQISGQYNQMRAIEIKNTLNSLGVNLSDPNSYSYSTSGSNSKLIADLIEELNSLTTR